MKLSDKGRALLESFEGFREQAYIPVPGDVATMGYGFTDGVRMGMHMTRAQADARLATELRQYEAAVSSACTNEPNQNQFDAMVCLCWNIGISAFSKSSVVRAHNRGDTNAAANAFRLWNKSGGKVYAGLTRRRMAEANLYLTPVPGAIQRAVEAIVPDAAADELPADPMPKPDDMPQTVDAERPMSESRINKGAVIAGGTATVATISTVSDAVNTVATLKDGIESLGTWLVPLLLLIAVGACGYIIWERFQQRKRGDA